MVDFKRITNKAKDVVEKRGGETPSTRDEEQAAPGNSQRMQKPAPTEEQRRPGREKGDGGGPGREGRRKAESKTAERRAK